MDIDNLNTGHVVKVTPEIFEQAAIDFSEGNEKLKELLSFCFENGIETKGCCSGHNGKQRPYILFAFNDENLQSILKILKQISIEDIVSNISFTKQPGVISTFCVSMHNDKFNEGFEQILSALKYEKEVDLCDLDETRQLMLKSVKNHSISNSYLEIQEEKDAIAVAVGDEYLSVLPVKKEIKPWTEDTYLVEDEKNSTEIKKTLIKLESKTKNEKYKVEYPYDNKKVNEFWEERQNSTILERNLSATVERQYEYGERNVEVVDVFPGANIEALANEIMQLHQYGNACITRFNTFVIDTRDYTTPQEIVEAYKNEIKRHQDQINKQQSNEKKETKFIQFIRNEVVTDDNEYLDNISRTQDNVIGKEKNVKDELE